MVQSHVGVSNCVKILVLWCGVGGTLNDSTAEPDAQKATTAPQRGRKRCRIEGALEVLVVLM